MNRKMAYAVVVLTLALGMGCAKRHSVVVPKAPEKNVVDLAAWVPREADVVVVVSSLEALKTSFEQLKTRSSFKQLEEVLETLPKEMEEEAGIEFFTLSTWQEMGFDIHAPLMLGVDTRAETVLLMAFPVADQTQLLASIEKHLVAKEKWEAQPGMPQGTYAWKARFNNFVFLEQQPGHVLVFLGDDLEALQKRAQLPKEKSWAGHKDILLKIDSRLPAGRVASVWLRMDENKVEEVEWVGAALVTHPRVKVVADITWRPGKKPLLPRMQTASFESKQWSQGLGNAMGGLWSSVEWDWYIQLLKQHASRDLGFEMIEMLGIILKQNLEPPVFARGLTQATQEDEEAFLGSVDILLKKGSSAEQFLNALAPLMTEGKIEATQLNAKTSVWKTQLGGRELMVQSLAQNKIRISDSAYSEEEGTPNALQKELMREMTSYPLAAALHLNALLELPQFRFLFGRRPLARAEYILLGFRAEEDHAQLMGEHFAEVGLR